MRTAIRTAGEGSLWVSLAAGAIVAFLAFSLSMAFRRRFRGDGIAFYIILLALMTPGFLLGLGTQIFWKAMGQETSLWHTALGTNTVWGIPFGFLVMMAIWNRYDDHIDEAARDLGANAARTFGEVTLPLVWTGIFGAFLFGFTLTWNDFDRTALLVAGQPDVAARDRRPDPGCRPPARSLRPRHGDDARLAGGDRHVPGRAHDPLPVPARRRCRASRRSWASAAGSTPRPQSRSSRGNSRIGDRLKPVPEPQFLG